MTAPPWAQALAADPGGQPVVLRVEVSWEDLLALRRRAWADGGTAAQAAAAYLHEGVAAARRAGPG